MANKPIPTPLTADLPTNWASNQIVAPTGAEVGLPTNYGYNYLMAKVNEARTAINTINDAFTNLPDANTLAQYLKLTGGTMTGNITMSGGTKVTGLPTPTENADAVPKNYVDQQLSQNLAQYLKLSGGTMTGNITMSSGAKVTGLPTPTENADAVPKNYVDQQLSQGLEQYLKLTGGTMTGNITMSSGSKVTGLPTPTENADAVPKKYVDNEIVSTVKSLLESKIISGTYVGNAVSVEQDGMPVSQHISLGGMPKFVAVCSYRPNLDTHSGSASSARGFSMGGDWATTYIPNRSFPDGEEHFVGVLVDETGFSVCSARFATSFVIQLNNNNVTYYYIAIM